MQSADLVDNLKPTLDQFGQVLEWLKTRLESARESTGGARYLGGALGNRGGSSLPFLLDPVSAESLPHLGTASESCTSR